MDWMWVRKRGARRTSGFGPEPLHGWSQWGGLRLGQEQVRDRAGKSGAQVGTCLLDGQTGICHLDRWMCDGAEEKPFQTCSEVFLERGQPGAAGTFSSSCTLLPFKRNAAFRSSAVRVFR